MELKGNSTGTEATRLHSLNGGNAGDVATAGSLDDGGGGASNSANQHRMSDGEGNNLNSPDGKAASSDAAAKGQLCA